MTRKEAGRRLLFGIVYLPLYYVLLYPIVFFVGVIAAAISIAFTIVTGRELDLKPQWTASSWESISQPVTWVFSGRKSDKPGWVP